jgi:hypothetical protein
MAESVVMWKAADGKLYPTEAEAIKVDAAVYKEKADKWDALKLVEAEQAKQRMPYHERGGHQ